MRLFFFILGYVITSSDDIQPSALIMDHLPSRLFNTIDIKGQKYVEVLTPYI